MQDDPRYVREAFDAGASGYVLKEAVDTDVVAAIRDVAAGGRYVHPALGARMVAADAEERKRAEETRSPTASATSCASSPSATPTRRSRPSSTSRCAPPRRTARTSCRSSRIATRAELVRYALQQGLLEVRRLAPFGYQVLARVASSGLRTRTRASTTTQRSGSASTGLRSSSATAGMSSPSRASRRSRSASAAPSAAGAPRNPRTSRPALPP